MEHLTAEGMKLDPADRRVTVGAGWRGQDDHSGQDDHAGHGIWGRLVCRPVLWVRTLACLGSLLPLQLESSRNSEWYQHEDYSVPLCQPL